MTGVTVLTIYAEYLAALFEEKAIFIQIVRVNTRCIQICCSAYGRYVIVYLCTEFYAIKPRFPRECVSSSGLFPV
jgi:hypothetical protein